jgi:hypothetical protein
MIPLALDAQDEAVGLAFDLPDGWICLDLRMPGLAGRVDQVLHVVLDGGVSRDPLVEQGIRDLVDRLVADGAHCLLMRPAVDGARVAITGGVFVSAPLRVSGAELYRTLDERGQPVALGDIDGMPIVSLVCPAPVPASRPVPGLQIVYLVCGDAATVLLSFAAAEASDPKCIVDEVARVLSRARVVRSRRDAGF